MKQLCLTLVLSCNASFFFGQIPILDSSNVSPIVGLNYSSTYDFPNSSQTTPGANVTWNYSTIGGMGGTIGVNCLSESNYPEDTLFPTSNTSYYYGATDYRILESSASSLKKWSHRTSSDNAYNLIEPEDILRFPFTYGDSYTDTWYGYYPWCQTGPCNTSSTITMPPTCKRRGTTTVNAIGYGTLILPGGNTYNNVLLIKTDVSYTDSIYFFSSLQVTSNSLGYYDWYLPGVHHPIAFAAYYTGFCGGFPTAHFAYLNNIPSNTISLQSFDAKHHYSVFPNPSSELVHYTVNGNLEASIQEIIVFNLLGEKFSINVDQLNKTIDVSELMNGIYSLVFVSSKGEQSSVKLVVAR